MFMSRKIVVILILCKTSILITGYRCLSLVLALSVVNCRSTLFCNSFLVAAHGASSALSVGKSGILLFAIY